EFPGEKHGGGLEDLVGPPGLGELSTQSAVLLLERLRGAGRGLGWPVAVAPDPQRLHANAELGRDSSDRLRSWATFECLAVVDHAHSTVTQLRAELLGPTPILLAETRNGTQGASDVHRRRYALGGVLDQGHAAPYGGRARAPAARR